MIKIGIIGYGYWGPNLLRNFSSLSSCKVLAVADSQPSRLFEARKVNPSLIFCNTEDELLSIDEIDAIVIATPVFSHYPIAKKALEKGKHVLVEKPMTASAQEAIELIDLAEKNGLVLMVDHTFLYTGAIQKIKSMIDSGVIGQPKYFDSCRINLGLFQSDVNVLWDLAPHDISILAHLFEEKPFSVNATGISHTKNGIENIAYMTVNYQTDFIAHFNCSWTSPVKIRQTLIGGDKKMIVYNDLEPSEKVRIYDTGYEYKSDEERKKILVDYRTGDVHIPKLSSKEALAGVANDFVETILSKKSPLVSAELGLFVTKVLEAAQKSIKNKGKEIAIQWN